MLDILSHLIIVQGFEVISVTHCLYLIIYLFIKCKNVTFLNFYLLNIIHTRFEEY